MDAAENRTKWNVSVLILNIQHHSRKCNRAEPQVYNKNKLPTNTQLYKTVFIISSLTAFPRK